jgi:putative transposase
VAWSAPRSGRSSTPPTAPKRVAASVTSSNASHRSAPRVAELLEAAEEDLLAFFAFPTAHCSKLRSTNPLERVNREIGRRADVVGIFPNDASALRLTGALLIEQNDEWLVCRRYLSDESMRLILNEITDPDISLPNNNEQEKPAALAA